MNDLREDCKGSPYYIDYIQEEDKDEVRDFLIKHYYTNEPVAKSIGLEITERMKREALQRIGIGYSLKAVWKESGKIVGIRLCTRVNRGDVHAPAEDMNEQEVSLSKFDDKVFEGCEVFELFPEMHYFLQGKCICVDPDYRGHGIGSALMDKMLDVMVEKEVPLLRLLCSNAFSAQIMKQRGFREMNRIYYADYLDENGIQMFNPEGPHKCAICYIKTLKDLQEERQHRENV